MRRKLAVVGGVRGAVVGVGAAGSLCFHLPLALDRSHSLTALSSGHREKSWDWWEETGCSEEVMGRGDTWNRRVGEGGAEDMG